MSVSRDLARGTLVVHYRIEAVLGRGGVGIVYLAEDLRLKRRVALKLLSPALAEDERFRERFLSESELAASLDHANVIPVYEAGEADGSLYIAMRYVEGSDLKAQLSDGPLTEEQAVALVEQIGGALDAAHERGLVHGDVKPSNVLIDGRGHAYLADFGLTKRVGGEQSPAEAQLMGTIDYVAPEQIRGDDVDGRADIYSLGCLFYECLTGRQPFKRGNDAAVLFAHLQDEPPATGGPADPVLARALAKSPEERYQSCAELAEDAREAFGVTASRRPRLPVAIAAAALLIAAAALAAFFLFRSGSAAAAPHGHLVRIDPKTNKTTADVHVGAVPSGVAVAPGSVWVTSIDDAGVWSVDTRTLRATRTPAQGTPIGVATRGSTAYIAETVSGPYGGAYDRGGQVTAVQTEGGRGLQTIETGTAFGIANSPGGLWVARQTDVVRFADASAVASTIDRKVPINSNASLTQVAVGAGGVWVLSDSTGRTLWRLDPRTGRIRATIALSFEPAGIAAGPDAVWVTAQMNDTVARIDPVTNRVVKTIRVGREPLAVAVGDGAVWVANTIDRSVTRIDPATNRVTSTIALDTSPTALAVGDGSVWVAADAS